MSSSSQPSEQYLVLSPLLTPIVRLFYLAAVASLLLTLLLGPLRKHLLPYGKALSSGTSFLTVPKSYFLHFYAFGFPWSLFLLFCLRKQNAQVLLLQTLLTVHLGRRLWESYGGPRTDARMHITHYIVGMAYYLFTPVAVSIDSWDRPSMGWRESTVTRMLFSGLLLFCASYQQNRAHATLARLRSVGSYGLPVEGWFRFVACPHYFWEMVIYLSFLGLGSGVTGCCMLIWVVVDLGIAGDMQMRWYRKRFGRSLPHGWKRIVPFVF